jgi:hypothetical protein
MIRCDEKLPNIGLQLTGGIHLSKTERMVARPKGKTVKE